MTNTKAMKYKPLRHELVSTYVPIPGAISFDGLWDFLDCRKRRTQASLDSKMNALRQFLVQVVGLSSIQVAQDKYVSGRTTKPVRSWEIYVFGTCIYLKAFYGDLRNAASKSIQVTGDHRQALVHENEANGLAELATCLLNNIEIELHRTHEKVKGLESDILTIESWLAEARTIHEIVTSQRVLDGQPYVQSSKALSIKAKASTTETKALPKPRRSTKK